MGLIAFGKETAKLLFNVSLINLVMDFYHNCFVLQAYVSDFNIFLKSNVNAEAVQVTHNGKKNEILNGIPDWVYEGK